MSTNLVVSALRFDQFRSVSISHFRGISIAGIVEVPRCSLVSLSNCGPLRAVDGLLWRLALREAHVVSVQVRCSVNSEQLGQPKLAKSGRHSSFPKGVRFEEYLKITCHRPN